MSPNCALPADQSFPFTLDLYQVTFRRNRDARHPRLNAAAKRFVDWTCKPDDEHIAPAREQPQ